jgi:glycine oxidase
METVDVAIVGAGVIGCAVAFELARAGARVVVLERDQPGAHASGAAAGMLAPIAEASEGSPLLELGLRSLEMFPARVAELTELSGIDPELTRCGILRVASGPECAGLERRARALESQGCQWLGREELAKREPRLAPDLEGGLWSPREGCVDPQRLVRAYAGAAQRRGARFEVGAHVVGLSRARERICGVRTADGELGAGEVVVCAGAWSAPLGRALGRRWPVEPVRGQMLALEAPQPPLASIVWSAGAYLVPRPDATLRVGATVERCGFAAHPSAAGVARLLEGARSTLPALGDSRFLSAWAGLRPETPDHLPLVGPVAALPGLWLATGHYRNGILLSALTARALADWMLEGRRTEGIEVLDPDRFGAADDPTTRT